MPEIISSMDDLSKRGQRIQRLLRPVCRTGDIGPAWRPRQAGTVFTIGAHNGAVTTDDPTQWRFSTAIRGFSASYYERWYRIDESGHNWYLDRAYFGVYVTNYQGTEREFLCLHCDPNEPETAPHAQYKRGLHLHVVAASQPIPHAHIALHCGYLSKILDSCESLTKSFEIALIMIRDELLDPIGSGKKPLTVDW